MATTQFTKVSPVPPVYSAPILPTAQQLHFKYFPQFNLINFQPSKQAQYLNCHESQSLSIKLQ